METLLQRFLAIDGVTGALLVGKDGLVVASTLEGEDEEFLGAMAAASFDASTRYIEQLNMGGLRHAHYETRAGTVHVTDGGELLLVVRCTQVSSIGRVRLEAERASERLAEQIGSY